jgi:hypothetical protein
MKLKDFDRIQLLALDERRNLHRGIDQDFARFGGKVERFYVGKGKILDNDKYDLIDTENIESSTWDTNSFSKNAYHCYVAHRKILQNALNDGVENLLLLEDDVQLLDNFQTNMNVLSEKNVPWDMWWGGYNLTWGSATEIHKDILKFNMGVYCWHCIGIRRHMFKVLLDLPAIGPFDYLTAKYIQPDSQTDCIGVWPVSAIQRPTFSYVNGCHQDYTEYFNKKVNIK